MALAMCGSSRSLMVRMGSFHEPDPVFDSRRLHLFCTLFHASNAQTLNVAVA